MPNGNPIAMIQIVMQATPEGVPDIRATFQGPDRNVFNMMMQRALQDVVPLLIEKDSGPLSLSRVSTGCCFTVARVDNMPRLVP